jgi:hypothetical protein
MERVVAKASDSAKYNSSIEIYLLLRTLHGDAWLPGCVFCSDECRHLDKAERTRTKREKYCTVHYGPIQQFTACRSLPQNFKAQGE